MSFSKRDGTWQAGRTAPISRLQGSSLSGSAAAPVSELAGRHGARKNDAAPEQRAAIEQAVAGDRLQRRQPRRGVCECAWILSLVDGVLLRLNAQRVRLFKMRFNEMGQSN